MTDRKLEVVGAVNALLLNDELETALGCPPGVRWNAYHDASAARVVVRDDTLDADAALAAMQTHVGRTEEEQATAQTDFKAKVKVDAVDRLQFEVLFDQENRIRVLEGKAAVTRLQYKAALVTRFKALT